MLEYVSPILNDKLPHYKLIDDIVAGGYKIKSSGEAYLPKEDGETTKSYDNRLAKGTFFDSFNPNLEGIAGLIFKNPIVYGDNIPSQLLPSIENADAQGNHFDVLLQNLFITALRKGICFALVDTPKGDNVTSKADEIAQGIKPYYTIIQPENVTSWKTETISGQIVLSQVKIRESVMVADANNPYAEEAIDQYRILTIGGYEIWQVQQNGEVKIESGSTGLNFIPLVALNLGGKEYFSAMPPFLDLANLNIAHYQIFTDSRHSAHIASVPMLKMFGFDAEEIKGMVVGANKAVATTNTDATVEWLDYDGGGVAINSTLLDRIETKMREIALSAITSDGNTTAFEVGVSTNQSQSKLNTYVRSLVDTAELMLLMAAKMYNLDDGGSIGVEADILTQPLTAQEALALNTMVVSGTMSIETMYSIIASGTFRLPSDFDKEAESEKIATDGMLSNDDSES
jgi:hypothetical protein